MREKVRKILWQTAMWDTSPNRSEINIGLGYMIDQATDDIMEFIRERKNEKENRKTVKEES